MCACLSLLRRSSGGFLPHSTRSIYRGAKIVEVVLREALQLSVARIVRDEVAPPARQLSGQLGQGDALEPVKVEEGDPQLPAAAGDSNAGQSKDQDSGAGGDTWAARWGG